MVWEYYKDNIGTGKKIATMSKKNGTKILDVCEGVDYLYIVPYYSFINPIIINYAEIIRKVNKDQLSNISRAEQILRAGCENIEKVYNERIEVLKKIILDD